jgi:hypothetical protein
MNPAVLRLPTRASISFRRPMRLLASALGKIWTLHSSLSESTSYRLTILPLAASESYLLARFVNIDIFSTRTHTFFTNRLALASLLSSTEPLGSTTQYDIPSVYLPHLLTSTIQLVSHVNPGQADINKEIFSEENPRFVLHDSQGFEPGEVDNFQRVRDFIQARNRMPNLKDKLHAIW